MNDPTDTDDPTDPEFDVKAFMQSSAPSPLLEGVEDILIPPAPLVPA